MAVARTSFTGLGAVPPGTAKKQQETKQAQHMPFTRKKAATSLQGLHAANQVEKKTTVEIAAFTVAIRKLTVLAASAS